MLSNEIETDLGKSHADLNYVHSFEKYFFSENINMYYKRMGDITNKDTSQVSRSTLYPITLPFTFQHKPILFHIHSVKAC